MKRNFSIVVLAFILAVTVSCKKKEIKANASLDPNTGLQKNGSYIKGDVTTKDNTDKAVQFSFDYAYQDEDMVFNPGLGGNGPLGGEYFYNAFSDRANKYPNRASFKMSLDSLADATPNPTTFLLRLQATPIVGSNGELFYFNFTGDQAKTLITNYTYTDSTNTASGKFTVTASTATGNGKSADINGSFLFKNIKYFKF